MVTDLEHIFQVLITFTKHLAETTTFITEQKSRTESIIVPESLVRFH